MYNADTLVNELLPLIGWRKSADPSATSNPYGDLLTASTGRYYNDQHPLLTNKNMSSIAEAFTSFTYIAWSALSTYAKGDIITSGDDHFVSLQNANTNHATSDAAWWRQTTPYSEWLRTKTAASIAKAFSDWFTTKFKNKTANNLLLNDRVIHSPGIETEVDIGYRRYVGFRVVPTMQEDITVTIHRASLQIQNGPDAVLRLYKNGADTPIETVSLTGDDTNDPAWIDTAWTLEPGNFYYIVYDTDNFDTDEVPINAIAGVEKTNWGYSRFPGMLPYMEVSAFDHEGPGEPGWNNVQSRLTNATNFGLNLSVSARCDYTKFILDQIDLFYPLVEKRVAMDMLRELAFNASARINTNERNVDRMDVLYEVDGNPQGRKTGIAAEYQAVLDSIQFDTRSISKECLPCRNRSIRIGSA